MMKIFTITECSSLHQASRLPDFIYNRFDLWKVGQKDQVSLWHYSSTTEDFYYETFNQGPVIQLGLWLVPASTEAYSHILKHCFDFYPHAKKVKLSNILNRLPGLLETNHFRILLPSTPDELDSRLSSKGRYNIRREKRIIEKTLGEISIFMTKAENEDAKPLWNRYFSFKKQTYNTQYNLSPSEYCDKYHVTNIYALMVEKGESPLAIILSCEATPIVYLENLSYDPEFSKLSVGQVLYDYYLKKLVEKGIKELYLLGGEYGYKKRYGSIEETVYSGYYYNNTAMNYLIEAFHAAKAKLRI